MFGYLGESIQSEEWLKVWTIVWLKHKRKEISFRFEKTLYGGRKGF